MLRIDYALQFNSLFCGIRDERCCQGETPPAELLTFLARQLGLSASVWASYAERDETRREHLSELQVHYGLRSFSIGQYRSLSAWLMPAVLQTNRGVVLVWAAIDELRRRSVIVARLAVLERLCAEVVVRSERQIYEIGSGETASVCRTIQATGSEWAFDDTKRKRSRHIVKLQNFILKAFPELREEQQGERKGNWSTIHELIFVSPAGLPLKQRAVKREFRRLLPIAGIRAVQLYDLRHAAATWAIDADVPVKVISDQLGHSQLRFPRSVARPAIATAERYQKQLRRSET